MGWQDAPKVTPTKQPPRQQPRQTGSGWQSAPKAPESRTWLDTVGICLPNFNQYIT